MAGRPVGFKSFCLKTYGKELVEACDVAEYFSKLYHDESLQYKKTFPDWDFVKRKDKKKDMIFLGNN